MVSFGKENSWMPSIDKNMLIFFFFFFFFAGVIFSMAEVWHSINIPCSWIANLVEHFSGWWKSALLIKRRMHLASNCLLLIKYLLNQPINSKVALKTEILLIKMKFKTPFRKQKWKSCYLAAPQPTLGHSQGDCLTSSMLSSAFLTILTRRSPGAT